jgi:hypothetical protein
MRIIERTDFKTHVRVFVVQDESWNGAGAYQNSLLPNGQVFGKRYQDIKSFATLQEAKDFAYQYHNNLAPGERIVS